MTDRQFRWFVIKALKLLIASAIGLNSDELRRRGMAWIRMVDSRMANVEIDLDELFEREVKKNR